MINFSEFFKALRVGIVGYLFLILVLTLFFLSIKFFVKMFSKYDSRSDSNEAK
ncbi:hypothetical protein [Fervidobacterium sp. 2310opik-2]|uniref:hypothetical protein n=1 Tax=Fervidobacterium sp. 2310opik-2 TaxID=1755815 RepID=UPI0013DEFD23|nr:hypothetical protein [Fervidobacterium sp. 2310opik-2]HOJ94268.1 hypothetical protein [Fervidobacterium nodosum]